MKGGKKKKIPSSGKKEKRIKKVCYGNFCESPSRIYQRSVFCCQYKLIFEWKMSSKQSKRKLKQENLSTSQPMI